MKVLPLVDVLWNDVLIPLVAGLMLAAHLGWSSGAFAGSALALTLMSLCGAIRGAGQDQTSRIQKPAGGTR